MPSVLKSVMTLLKCLQLTGYKCMQENPLKERICKVFSSDKSGNMTFDDFLNMCSMFNEQCPRNTKIYYAFQIYGKFGSAR